MRTKKYSLILFYFSVYCAIYLAFYMILKDPTVFWNDVFSTVTMLGFDIAIFCYSFWLWKTTKTSFRHAFGIIAISTVCICITEIANNILHKPLGDMSILWLSAYHIPVTLFLFLECILRTLERALLFYGLCGIGGENAYEKPQKTMKPIDKLRNQALLCVFISCIIIVGINGFMLFFKLDYIHLMAIIFPAIVFISATGNVFLSNLFLRSLQKFSENTETGLSLQIATKTAHHIPKAEAIEAFIKRIFTVIEEKNTKLTTLTQLTASATHDVVSPLMALKMSLDTMKDEIPQSSEEPYRYAVFAYEEILRKIKKLEAAVQFVQES